MPSGASVYVLRSDEYWDDVGSRVRDYQKLGLTEIGNGHSVGDRGVGKGVRAPTFIDKHLPAGGLESGSCRRRGRFLVASTH